MWFDGPYSNIGLYRTRSRNIKPHKQTSPPKRCQETCPRCGRKMVNVYLQDGEWKCRLCCEAAVSK